MKSLLVDVFWPASEWGPCNMPHLRYIAFTTRDNNKWSGSSRAHRTGGNIGAEVVVRVPADGYDLTRGCGSITYNNQARHFVSANTLFR
jgi:hypothetical protein